MTRGRRLSLPAAIAGSFVVGLDATVVNVALPSVSAELGGGLAGQQAIVNGYLLALAAFILLGGSLADIFGARRVFSLGILGFGVASIFCAVAPSIEVLAGARVAQGTFGALVTPSALALVAAAYPAEGRAAAIGSWAAWSGIASLVGPLVGGQLVDLASWRLVFAIGVPFVVAALLLVQTAVPDAPPRTRRPPIDWPGALLSLAALAGPTLALVRQPAAGWTDPVVVLPALGGGLAAIAFLRREARTAHPMLPLTLFARRNFAAANAQTVAIYAALGVVFFQLNVFLQQVAGHSAAEAGLVTLPSTIALFALSRRAGRLADRHGPRLLMGAGPLVAASGLLLLALRVDADAEMFADVLPALSLFGLGLGLTVAPLTATVLAGAPKRHTGIASAVNTALARSAGLLGVAAVGAVIAAQFSATVADRLEPARLTPAAQVALRDAESRTLAVAEVAALGPHEARIVSQATERAAVHAVRVGLATSAALLALGGLIAIALVRDPRARRSSSPAQASISTASLRTARWRSALSGR